jgi:hypothetical protein
MAKELKPQVILPDRSERKIPDLKQSHHSAAFGFKTVLARYFVSHRFPIF